MSSRPNTRSSGVNDENQTNEVEGLTARRINATLPNLISQIVAALNAGRVNDGGSSSNSNQGCNYKTFLASKPKEFYGTKGAIGLLSTDIDKYTTCFYEMAIMVPQGLIDTSRA
ncbi:hypothetical protein Tco_0885640 [Tanacetum coccineum]